MKQIREIALLPIVLAVPLLVLSGCGQGSEARDETAAVAEKVVQVHIAEVVQEDLQETFVLPGTLEAWEDLTLAAEISGPVRWIGPREGERIQAGQALLRIDPETLEANRSRDQAAYELRQRQLQRLEKLHRENFVSAQEYEIAAQAYQVAEADLRRSRLALEKSTLRAPVDGVLDRLMVDRGEYVSDGTPVAVVVQVDRLRVLVDIPEKDVAFLRPGQQVQVTAAAMDSGPQSSIVGEIIHLSFKADPLTRTYQAKIAVDNGDGRLRPGMIVRVGLNRRELPQVIAVPLFAVVDRGGSRFVFVEEGGQAVQRPVQIGAVLGERVVIQAGLAHGERLIVQGQHLLSDGVRVTQGAGIRPQVSGQPEAEEPKN
jgi:membrane fusion protein, multidrug efflux system